MRAHEHDRMFRLEAEHFWFVGTRRVIVDVLTRTLGERLEGARVLDLGCGTGYTLTQLPPAVRAFGLDRSPHALALCERRDSGAELVRGDATALPFRDGSFDAVLALDVLEHIPDDGAAAREIARLLAPGGIALITVPAFGFLWSAHDEALEHQRRYRLPEIAKLVRDAGLTLELRTYYNTLLFPLVAGARLAGRLKASREEAPSADLALPPRPLNRALAAVLGAERHLLRAGRLPFGVSCLLVARRA